ncbi:L,D-transpeptidase family protein [Solirubrobacter phytolaccae]|uniref:L,D-transpeptidase family protein n=1 Tax=Solirubrobacter phytolaccae TaxID=1404360 RepID=A0A9X3S7R1_9ACTN|nr:L,D-transpeptidase family protein [Solirubrobacter phytolaccae]MDA0181324.1 L,D-transpeptidase family protein [Solirubrobacter phytolaccae]
MILKKFVGLAAATLVAAAAVFPAVASAERVSTLGKESFFAYVNRAEVARAEPSPKAKKVAKLTLKTPEKTDDLVFVLERTEVDGEEWLKVRLPVRPNNTTGWVPATALSELQPVDTWLKISTKTFKITLIKNGKKVFSAPIGVGQSQWPTPKGQFYIRAKLKGYGGAGSVYGPLAYITSATSDTLTDWPGGGLVGVHGTNQPGILPGRVSHGCVRLKNADILKLEKLMPVGTPITIT